MLSKSSIFTFFLLYLLSSTAIAQSLDLKWDPRFTCPGIRRTDHINSVVANSTGVYIGGYFSNIGSLHTSGLVMWDGVQWNDIGKKIFGDCSVSALALDSSGNLYAAGRFDSTSYNTSILKWDGKTWRDISKGKPPFISRDPYEFEDSTIKHLEIRGSKLIVDGVFEYDEGKWKTRKIELFSRIEVDSITVKTIAGVDARISSGTSWERKENCKYGLIRVSSKKKKEIGSILFRWEDTVWVAVPMPEAFNGEILDNIDGVQYFELFFHRGDNKIIDTTVASFDGIEWKYYKSSRHFDVNKLIKSNGNLYAFGTIRSGGRYDPIYPTCAKWNGNDWDSLFEINPVMVVPFHSGIFCIGNTYEIGCDLSNIIFYQNNKRYDLSPGGAMGLSTDPSGIVLFKDTILICDGSACTYNIGTSSGIVAWDEMNGSWLSHSRTGGLFINGMAATPNILYASAQECFPVAGFGGSCTNCIYKWDGINWNRLGTERGFNSRSNSAVKCLLPIGDSGLFVGGSFKGVDSVACNNIVFWNGKHWQPVGFGVTDTAHRSRTYRRSNGEVYSMLQWGNDMYIGGSFSQANGQTINNIARYDGEKWYSVGSGLSGEVQKLAVYNNQLIAIEKFPPQDTSRYRFNHLVTFRDNAWKNILPPTGYEDNEISAILSDSLFLYCAFNFSENQTNGLFRWDGKSWTCLCKSFGCSIIGMVIKDAYLYAATSGSWGEESSGFGILKLK